MLPDLTSFSALADQLDARPSRRAALRARHPGLPGAVAFADAAVQHLHAAARGAHHTPWDVAGWVAGTLLGDDPAAFAGARVLDPACGAGHLLLAVAEAGGLRPADDWIGWDIDAESVAATRIALWLAHDGVGRVADYGRVRCRDPLLEPKVACANLVIANPPFLSVRALNRDPGASYVAAVRAANPALRGSFDLYAGFVAATRSWLHDTGRFALIVPATLWSARYAGPARAAIAGHITAVHTLRPEGLFPGRAVHTDVVIGTAGAATRALLCESRVDGPPPAVRQTVGSLALADGLPGPATRESVPLGSVARVTAGTPGYQAHAVAELVFDGSDEARTSPPTGSTRPTRTVRPFVVTRSVRRYAVDPGPVRFLGAVYEQARIDTATLSEGKRALYAAPKVLVGGVSRGLIAARDTLGVAMGVGVYAVLPVGISSACVVALLNADCVAAWYRQRFRGRRLSGGYFAVNCGNLREVPVPARWLADAVRCSEIEALVRQREDATDVEVSAAIDAQIDDLIRTDLFRLE